MTTPREARTIRCAPGRWWRRTGGGARGAADAGHLHAQPRAGPHDAGAHRGAQLAAAGNILIAASHTHGGPAAVSLYQTPAATDAEIEAFLKKAAEAVIEADKESEAGRPEGRLCERVLSVVQPAAALPRRQDAHELGRAGARLRAGLPRAR